MAGFKFSKDAAERTKKAVIAVEREISSLGGETRPSRGNGNHGFYAKITAGSPNAGNSGGVNDYKYSWIKVEMLPTGLWGDKSEWGTGDRTKDTGYAVEAIYRSAYVPKGSIVWMYPAPGQDFFLFDFEGSPRHGMTTSSITAMSGATLGKGTARFEKQIVDNLGTDDNTPEMLVYNKSGTAIDSSKRVTVFMVDGRWQVVYEDCG